MSKNVIREIRNQVRAEARMKAQFERARLEAMGQAEEFISSLYQHGEETREFSFNASSWGTKATDCGAEDLWKYIKAQDFHGDTWHLTKEQATMLLKMVEDWNSPWEYEIARRYDVDQMEYYNAYSIGFGPAIKAEASNA